MPQVTGSGSLKKITFDSSDALGGLAPQYGVGTKGTKDILGKLSGATSMNPYRYLGNFAPGYNPQDPTNTASLTAYLKKGVVDSTSIYATSHGADLEKITIGVTPAVVDDATWPYTVTAHAAANTPVLDDCLVYTTDIAGTKTRSLLYSWSDSASWDVGLYNLGATFDDDWMTTQPASVLAAPYTTGGQGKKHPMIVAEDDITYIGDRNYIHAFDGQTGTDGTFEDAVLTIKTGMEFRSFVNYPGFLVGFAYRPATSSGGSYYEGEAKAYFWDLLSQDPYKVFSLGDNYVGEAFAYQGTIGVFTQGRAMDLESSGNRSSRMQIFRGFGTGFTEEITFDDNVPERGGVWVGGSMIQWNSEGNQYSYGAPFAGLEPKLNKIAQGASSGTSGMLLNPTTDFWLMSPTTSAGSRLKYFKSGNYSEGDFNTVNAEPNFSDQMMGQVEYVKVYFAKVASGGRNFTLSLSNQAEDTTEIITAADNLTTITASTIIKKYSDESQKMRFSTLKINGAWGTGSGSSNAPVVSKVEVYFREVNINDV